MLEGDTWLGAAAFVWEQLRAASSICVLASFSERKLLVDRRAPCCVGARAGSWEQLGELGEQEAGDGLGAENQSRGRGGMGRQSRERASLWALASHGAGWARLRQVIR